MLHYYYYYYYYYYYLLLLLLTNNDDVFYLFVCLLLCACSHIYVVVVKLDFITLFSSHTHGVCVIPTVFKIQNFEKSQKKRRRERERERKMENSNILNLTRITRDDVENDRLTKTDMVC